MAYEQVKVETPLILRVLPVASLLCFFAVWQGVVDFGIVPNSMLASPTQVAALFWRNSSWRSRTARRCSCSYISIIEALTGFLLALAVGIPLVLLMGWFVLAEGLARPIFEMIRPIPPVAWIPLTIFWYGIVSGKVFIIWLSGIVPRYGSHIAKLPQSQQISALLYTLAPQQIEQVYVAGKRIH